MKRRDLSKRDRERVEYLIQDVCRMTGLNPKESDFMNIGWEAFLDVYRCQPESFYGAGGKGWYAAAKVMFEKMAREKAALDFAWFGTCSLDMPVSDEVPVSRLDMLPSKNGDFQNGVCLMDYVNGLYSQSADAGFLARRFMEGDTLEEIRLINHWSPHRTYQALHVLREAMEAYCNI